MLVLNTNQGGEGDLLSNESMRISWPDRKNSICLFPITDTPYDKVVWTINWTNINARAWFLNVNSLYKLQLKMNSNGAILYPPKVWFSCNIQATWTYIWRLSHPTPLEAWMTIWKTIVLPNFQQIYFGSWLDTQIKVWILHSDWTITYLVDETNAQQYTDSSTEMMNYWGRWTSWTNYKTTHISNKLYETNWYTTQEWDRIVFEVNTIKRWDYAQDYAFWTLRANSENSVITPLQISID